MTGHTNLAQISRDDASSNKAHLEMELLLELEMELKSKNPQSHKSNAHIFSGGSFLFRESIHNRIHLPTDVASKCSFIIFTRFSVTHWKWDLVDLLTGGNL